MPNDVFIIGAGGFARETYLIVDQHPELAFRGYLVDRAYQESWGTTITGGKVVGPPETALQEGALYYVGIGDGRTREKIIGELGVDLLGPALVHPDVKVHASNRLAPGTIICGGSQLTVDIEIDLACVVNLSCTIGHDVTLAKFVTLSPLCAVSGNVLIGERSNIGTGTKIREKTAICADAIVGAGAVVVEDILEPGVYVGTPARRLR